MAARLNHEQYARWQHLPGLSTTPCYIERTTKRRMLGGSTFRSLARYTNDRWQHLPDLQFRRRLSAEGVKPESNNRWISELVMHVCMFVWYLRLSRDPQHSAKQLRYNIVGVSRAHRLGTLTFVFVFCACASIFWRCFAIFPIPLCQLRSNLLSRACSKCVILCGRKNHVTHYAHALDIFAISSIALRRLSSNLLTRICNKITRITLRMRSRHFHISPIPPCRLISNSLNMVCKKCKALFTM